MTCIIEPDPIILLETALLSAQEPLAENVLYQLFDPPPSTATLQHYLITLQALWAGRGLDLRKLASGWRFSTKLELAPYLQRLSPEKPPRYSRAVMETLAIIAYKQPVTRGDIEAIRGVSVSTHIMQTLQERGWIEAIGKKDIPGRPSLYATTPQCLDDLGLASLDQLPPLTELGNLIIPVSPEDTITTKEPSHG